MAQDTSSASSQAAEDPASPATANQNTAVGVDVTMNPGNPAPAPRADSSSKVASNSDPAINTEESGTTSSAEQESIPRAPNDDPVVPDDTNPSDARLETPCAPSSGSVNDPDVTENVSKPSPTYGATPAESTDAKGTEVETHESGAANRANTEETDNTATKQNETAPQTETRQVSEKTTAVPTGFDNAKKENTSSSTFASTADADTNSGGTGEAAGVNDMESTVKMEFSIIPAEEALATAESKATVPSTVVSDGKWQATTVPNVLEAAPAHPRQIPVQVANAPTQAKNPSAPTAAPAECTSAALPAKATVGPKTAPTLPRATIPARVDTAASAPSHDGSAKRQAVLGLHGHIPVDALPPCCRAALPRCCIDAGFAPILKTFGRHTHSMFAPSTPRPPKKITHVLAQAVAATPIQPATTVSVGDVTPARISHVAQGSVPPPAAPTYVASTAQPQPAVTRPDTPQIHPPASRTELTPVPVVPSMTAPGNEAAASTDFANVETPPATPTVAAGSSSTQRRTFPDGQHVTIWNTTERRKIAGNAAPLGRNLDKYLEAHADCEVYVDQDEEDSKTGRKRGRPDGEACAGDHVPIWNRRERRKIAGNAAPLMKNLETYLAKRPDCEPYAYQDLQDKSEAQRRRIVEELGGQPGSAICVPTAVGTAASAASPSANGELSIVRDSAPADDDDVEEPESIAESPEIAPDEVDMEDPAGHMENSVVEPPAGHTAESLAAWVTLEDNNEDEVVQLDMQQAANFFLNVDLNKDEDDEVSLAILTGPETGTEDLKDMSLPDDALDDVELPPLNAINGY